MCYFDFNKQNKIFVCVTVLLAEPISVKLYILRDEIELGVTQMHCFRSLFLVKQL